MSSRSDFEAWCVAAWGSHAIRHMSGTSGEWDAWQACAERKDRRIAELEGELTLRRKSGSATDRLHNICEGISRDADGSEWSREEWERLDAENAALRKQVTALRGATTMLLIAPFGCPFCHSGKLINPAKGHTDGCGFGMASAALAYTKETP